MKLAQHEIPVNKLINKGDDSHEEVIVELDEGTRTEQMEAAERKFWQLLLGRLLKKCSNS